jgi:hypothetical protein
LEDTCTENLAETRASIDDSGEGTPRINLSTAEDIRREMARVYREARAGAVDTTQASKLVYILSQITKAHELGVIEKRLTELEQATVKGKK